MPFGNSGFEGVTHTDGVAAGDEGAAGDEADGDAATAQRAAGGRDEDLGPADGDLLPMTITAAPAGGSKPAAAAAVGVAAARPAAARPAQARPRSCRRRGRWAHC